MKVTNDINKASWQVLEHMKDLLGRTIADAASRGDLKIERPGLVKLIALVNMTAEQAFHEANRNFEKSVVKAIEAHDLNKTGEKTAKKKLGA